MEHIYRPMTKIDYDAYYDIMKTEYLELFGNFNLTKEEVISELPANNWNMSEKTQLVFTPDGEIIAYQVLHDSQEVPVLPAAYGYVKSEYRGQGIGTRLLQWSIACAKNVFERVPEDARVVLRAYSSRADESALLADNGFTTNRQSLHMHRHLNGDLPRVALPDNIQIFNFAEHPMLSDFVRVQRESFRDHRGYTEAPLEKAVQQWQQWIDAASDFDPELFVLLREGDADVGVLLMWPASEEDPAMGWVDVMGIMPEYRRRGLGTQLMYYGFNLLKERGIPKVGLSVDGSSLTGAHELYEKVGMCVAHHFDAYELELRPGKELSQQGNNYARP